MTWIEDFIIEEARRRNPPYSIVEDTKIVEQIDEIVRSLAARYGVRVEKDEEQPTTMRYGIREDCIYYNPYKIKESYEKLSRHDHIRLADLVEHIFGHELGHRKKHKKFTGYEWWKVYDIHRTMYSLAFYPEEAKSRLSKSEYWKSRFPLLRAAAIAYVLFEEYYAVKENPLRKPSIERMENSVVTNNIKRKYLRDAIRALHTLSRTGREGFRYFIIPLAYLSASSLKVFPYGQYYILRKIKTFLQQKIITAQDVFDLNKIAQVADIIIYELEMMKTRWKILPKDERVKHLEDWLKSVIFMDIWVE